MPIAVATVEHVLLYGIILPLRGLVLLAMPAAVLWLLWRVHPMIAVVFVVVQLAWLALEFEGEDPGPERREALLSAC